MHSAILDFLKRWDVEYRESLSLAEYSSIGCGGIARLAVFPSSINKTAALISFLNDLGAPYRVIGNMTNTLFRDCEHSGILIKTDKLNKYFVAENTVTVEAGALYKRLAARLSLIGISLFEELFMIPGSIGAMVLGNAGAHGKETSGLFISGEFLNPSGERITLSRDEMDFAYRTSYARSSGLVCLSVTLRCFPDSFSNIATRIKNFADIRRAAQPTNLPSLGSVFKKHDGVGMGYYIERAGLSGYRIGGAEVSRKHAGFIVNVGGATASDVIALRDFIKVRVFEKFGFMPEEEIEVL